MGTQELNCGLDCPNVPDLFVGLSEVERLQYSFLCTSIVHPRLRRRYTAGGKSEVTMFTRTDIVLDPNDWCTRVVARISPYLSVDSPFIEIRQQHEDALMEELNYCRGLGISTLLLTLKGNSNNNLARIVTNYYINSHFNPIFWIQVPMENPALRAFDARDIQDYGQSDTWKWWSDFHRLTEWDRRISLVLVLSADLPSAEDIDRWLGEPIRCLIIPTSVFATNRKNYPVLSKPHQAFIVKLLERDIQMMVTGINRHDDMSHYVKYLKFLWDNKRPRQLDAMSQYAKGWEDHLQTPLQPLSDNLDTYTYNVFEKDPIKYNYYQKAIFEALKSRYNYTVVCKKNCLQSSPVKDKDESNVVLNGDVANSKNELNDENDVDSVDKKADRKCVCKHSSVVMVLGAGRGPLVKAVLNASIMANVDVKVYAVEKNPTALVTLHALQREIWGDQVTIIASDMRKFQPEKLADIIVSELLGSFGDNELSPECLDYARHLLKEDGISIPASYTSHLSPVMCPRLWGLARATEREPSQMRMSSIPHPLETPWVVYFQNKYEIAPPQELFTFTHPCNITDGDYIERRRWKVLRFPVSNSCTLHGFSGYFSCVLYDGINLSIVPETHTKGMISWFPIFFPIKSPISLLTGQEVEVNFWRCSNQRKVWYEWNVTSPELQGIHNAAGKSSDMTL